MTEHAKSFVGALTFQAVSGFPVGADLFDPAAEAAMGHIELARWADLLMIVPASANTIAKISHALADDLLSTLCLATPAQLVLCPAMNQQMWANALVQANISTLKQANIAIWGPTAGDQACGDVGLGRLLEPMDIVQRVQNFFNTKEEPILADQKIVITAGPTQEAIDPVRFISNHSSGKMGFALAEQAQCAGAEVLLISGPVNLPTPKDVTRIDVINAEEMLQASLVAAKGASAFIGCAAVADYRSADQAAQKIKKSVAKLTLSLVANPDILAEVAHTYPQLTCVGFAAETENVHIYAERKLHAKKLAMICANDVSQPDIGFNAEENAMLLLIKNGDTVDSVNLPKASKSQIARQIVLEIAKLIG